MYFVKMRPKAPNNFQVSKVMEGRGGEESELFKNFGRGSWLERGGILGRPNYAWSPRIVQVSTSISKYRYCDLFPSLSGK